MRSMLVTMDYSLYDEISSDQPPLFTYLLAGLQQRASREPTVELIELKKLWARYPDVSPIRIVAPLGMGQCSTPTLEKFTKDARELSSLAAWDKRKDAP